jgi:hypothetical protein
MKGSTTWDTIPYRNSHKTIAKDSIEVSKKNVSLMGSNNSSISMKVVFIKLMRLTKS